MVYELGPVGLGGPLITNKHIQTLGDFRQAVWRQAISALWAAPQIPDGWDLESRFLDPMGHYPSGSRCLVAMRVDYGGDGLRVCVRVCGVCLRVALLVLGFSALGSWAVGRESKRETWFNRLLVF